MGHKWLVGYTLLVLVAFGGCRRQENTSKPPESVTSKKNQTNEDSKLPVTARKPSKLFELLASETTGVHFKNVVDKSHPMKRLYESGYACGGVSIGDVDGDGKPDLFLVSGPHKNKLYRQTGKMKFADMTDRAGVDGGEAWSSGAAMIDIDGDEDLDLYVCNYDESNHLFVNQGDGTFIESAEQFGLDFADASLMPAFCDYDLDGDLDLYLLTNRLHRAGGRPARPPVEFKDGKPYVLPEFERYYGLLQKGPKEYDIDNVGRPDQFFKNNGDGTFTNVTNTVGINSVGHGLSVTWWDYNQDGFPDVYIGNDYLDPDHLYHNNGDGTFRDVIKETMPHTTWFSMGADVADINNDGRLDFLVGDMSATNHFKEKTTMGAMGRFRWFLESAEPRQYMRNALYLNTGTKRFMEVGYLTSLAESNWTWAVKMADFDNDGRVDVFFTNGIVRNFSDADHLVDPRQYIGKSEWEIHEDRPTRPEKNIAFRNQGDFDFADVSKEWGLDHLGMSYSSAYGDLDNDGDLDLVVANIDQPVSIYRNRGTTGNFLTLRLNGDKANRYGIGASVRIETASGMQVRQMMPMTGFLSTNQPIVHFGLGGDTKVDKLTVHWPGGSTQQLKDLKVNQSLTINLLDLETTVPEAVNAAEPMYKSLESLSGIRHQEKPFDDYKRQPLLPNKMSQLGPGIAWGDIDSDGDDDLYIGGAAGQRGRLQINDGEGNFEDRIIIAFIDDADCENMAALFFDADGDDDLDLYVVSGSGEFSPKDKLLQDRIYLNDGQGNFSLSPEGTLPTMQFSGSSVVAADFDRDGDLDLFIGGRLIPGQYPLSPGSRLLENQNGKFTDVTVEQAPQLKQAGMVSSAIWSDVDGDSWVDLMVTQEWGSVKFYKNLQGRLMDRSQEAGLADRLGWFNSIAASDVDGDGDIDYAVTNFGLNTKYHASVEKPALLYYGDFEYSGRFRLVEAEYEDHHLFPIRGKSCSSSAMPFLTKKFTTYKDFAQASLSDIYTEDCLENAHRFAATSLESGMLINEGAGRFRFQAFPRLAQASPGFGIVITEIDGDGHPDLYFVQNFFSPQPETGRMDGGLSLLLTGNGDGTFQSVWPKESGLIVSGDAKGLAACDINGDSWPDFVISNNDGNLQAFQHQGKSEFNNFVVRLQGISGNPTAVGSRVTLTRSDGSKQTAELYAGSGYLSQSSRELFFGLGSSARPKSIEVTWPDGEKTALKSFEPDRKSIVLKHPELSTR